MVGEIQTLAVAQVPESCRITTARQRLPDAALATEQVGEVLAPAHSATKGRAATRPKKSASSC